MARAETARIDTAHATLVVVARAARDAAQLDVGVGLAACVTGVTSLTTRATAPVGTLRADEIGRMTDAHRVHRRVALHALNE